MRIGCFELDSARSDYFTLHYVDGPKKGQFIDFPEVALSDALGAFFREKSLAGWKSSNAIPK